MPVFIIVDTNVYIAFTKANIEIYFSMFGAFMMRNVFEIKWFRYA